MVVISTLLDTLFESIKLIIVVAAIVALATTPIAFAVLGRRDWFQARRGRVMMRPAFSSIVVGMMLVMGVPAIFLALVAKSQDFDKNRYEFDPGKTWSVLEQGRAYKSVQEADKAVELERVRLVEERKTLFDNVRKLDTALVKLRSVAGQSVAVTQAMPDVLETLAALRKSVNSDGPQQWTDITVPITPAQPGMIAANPAGAGAAASPLMASAPVAPPAPVAAGLAKSEADAELATVPEPQRPLASMLPMTDLPPGWTVSKYGTRHLETFNAANMFEKIDGRAESFTQNDVTGMVYTSYHPIGDDSNEVQIYIFEFDHAKDLRAQSKYVSEKPETLTPVKFGTEGYTSAGSVHFYADPFYTQVIVTTEEDPKFAKFALEMAKRIAAKQSPEPSGESMGEGEKPAPVQSKAAQKASSIYALLPKGPGREEPKFVAQDVFGYGFFSNIYMADYKDGPVTWQGYLRPYATAEEAQAVFEEYVASAKKDGGDPKPTPRTGLIRWS